MREDGEGNKAGRRRCVSPKEKKKKIHGRRKNFGFLRRDKEGESAEIKLLRIQFAGV